MSATVSDQVLPVEEPILLVMLGLYGDQVSRSKKSMLFGGGKTKCN